MQKRPSEVQKGNQARKQRTIDLLSESIKRLKSGKIDVTVAAIIATSKKIDPMGGGISYSAIRHNPDAYVLFKSHAKYLKKATRKRAKDWYKEVTCLKIVKDRQAKLRRLIKNNGASELAEGILVLIEMNAELQERYLELSVKYIKLTSK